MVKRDWGKIMVGVRREKMVIGHFYDNTVLFLVNGGLRDGDGMGIAAAQPAHHAANELGRKLIKSKFDSLLFIDSDASFPIDTLERLRTLPEGQEFDILQAFYVTRSFPMTPLWLIWDDEKKFWIRKEIRTETTEEVQGVGFHFTLIRREVLETLARPWFIYPPDEGSTEDVPFCTRAREAGFRIGATSKVKTRHWGEYPFSWQEYQDQLAQRDSAREALPPFDAPPPDGAPKA
jgi:hypothetical protein